MISRNDEVANAVLEILSMHLEGYEMREFDGATSLAELEIDSLGIAAILAHVEQILAFRFSSEQLIWCYEVSTVDEFIAAVKRARSGER